MRIKQRQGFPRSLASGVSFGRTAVNNGEACVPADFVRISAIPRTHNAKAMRNVVQRLFLSEGGPLKEVRAYAELFA